MGLLQQLSQNDAEQPQWRRGAAQKHRTAKTSKSLLCDGTVNGLNKMLNMVGYKDVG